MSEPNAQQAPNAWRVLFLLFLVNLLNFFDRVIPAIVNEPIRREWGLTDLELGLIASAFTIVYAIAGVPLGRASDTGSRKKILVGGVLFWSAMTALTGKAWSYASFFLIRLAVGVGEASCAPASLSMIGDMFPASKRSKAMGVFVLGLPLGLLLAFFTVGAMVKRFGSWREPFFIAAVPGVLLAALLPLIREPARGAAEAVKVAEAPVVNPIGKVLKIKTMIWIILSGVTYNFAAYGTNSFMVSLLQRYHQLPLEKAAVFTGVIVGVTGLIGLTLGGVVADMIYRRNPTGRLVFGAIGLVISAPATYVALGLGAGKDVVTSFVLVFGLGWLAGYMYYTTVYPALQDVVEPRLRATAMAVYFAGMYILGGAAGSVVVGGLSDSLAKKAMAAAGAPEMTDTFKAVGLHDAMYLIPITLALTAIMVFLASRTFAADAERMKREMAAGS